MYPDKIESFEKLERLSTLPGIDRFLGYCYRELNQQIIGIKIIDDCLGSGMLDITLNYETGKKIIINVYCNLIPMEEIEDDPFDPEITQFSIGEISEGAESVLYDLEVFDEGGVQLTRESRWDNNGLIMEREFNHIESYRCISRVEELCNKYLQLISYVENTGYVSPELSTCYN